MARRIVLVLMVLTTLFTVTTTVATADTTMKPDGIWEMNDGDDWVRFYERGFRKQAQWHSDSYEPCRGGPAASVSANWSYDDTGVHVKIWARCETARIRLQPFEFHFQWAWDGDLVDQNNAEWQNYLYHRAPPVCTDFGTHSIYQTTVVGLDLVIDIPAGVFDFTLGNFEAELVCTVQGCDDWHVDITFEDTLDSFFPFPPFFAPAGTAPTLLVFEANGPVRPCETVECVVQGFIGLPGAPLPFGFVYDETNIAGYATCSAIVTALTP